jgi:hypothetical protein
VSDPLQRAIDYRKAGRYSDAKAWTLNYAGKKKRTKRDVYGMARPSLPAR